MVMNGRKWFGIEVSEEIVSDSCLPHIQDLCYSPYLGTTTIVLHSANLLIYLKKSERVLNSELDKCLQAGMYNLRPQVMPRLLVNFCEFLDLSS